MRWRRDGVLEFVGRADDQVKIRGFRVEPGEVQAVIAEVAQNVVVARDGRLIAYVVGDLEAARVVAGQRLPEYMVPSVWVAMDALPLTVNGKVDRAALPVPDAPVAGRAAANAIEEVLCGLFGEVLGIAEVPADGSFFDLGGDSIMSMMLVSKARKAGLTRYLLR